MSRKTRKPRDTAPRFLPPLDSAQRYTVEEALAYLRISRARFYELVDNSSINTFLEGRRRFIHGGEIARLSRGPFSAPPAEGA